MLPIFLAGQALGLSDVKTRPLCSCLVRQQCHTPLSTDVYLTGAMEDVIEYNFIAQPDWISEAIEFTDSGIELNFKKLSNLCGQSKLPSRLCIILEGSQSTNNSLSVEQATVQQTIGESSGWFSKHLRLCNDRHT